MSAHPHQHACDLSQHEPDRPPHHLPAAAPFSNLLTRLCYRCRYFASVSARTPLARRLFRSEHRLLEERRRHLATPALRHVIHPCSALSQAFSFARATLWALVMFYDTFTGGFHYELVLDYDQRHRIPVYVRLMQAYNCFELAAILFDLNCGYVHDETQVVVLEPYKVFRQYLRTYLVTDLIPPVACLLYYTLPNLTNLQTLGVYHLRTVRFIRVITFVRVVNDFLMLCRVDVAKRCVGILVFFGVLSMHILTCLYANIQMFASSDTAIEDLHASSAWMKEVDTHDSKWYTYMRCFILIVTHFFGANYHYDRFTSFEKVCLSIALIGGMLFMIVSLAVCLLMFGFVNVSESKFEEMQMVINEFMNMKKYPKVLKARINLFYDFRFGQRFFNTNKIMAQLSEHLRNEVVLYSCRVLIERVQIFKGLSRPAIGALLSVLKHDYYLAEDTIVACETPTESLYLVLHGTCAVLIENKEELLHLEDGDEFGDTLRVQTEMGVELGLMAVEPTDIYFIKKPALNAICNHYPEVATRIDGVLKTKRKIYETLLMAKEAREEGATDLDDIIANVRRGNVLQKPRRRKIRAHNVD